MKRVLVTGTTGFIGANLLRELLEEHTVTIIIRKESNTWRINDLLTHENLTVTYGDLSSAKDVKKIVLDCNPEWVFHLATYGAYPDSQKELELIVHTNILGTINLLEACSEVNYDAFIDVGSSSEYGLKEKPMNEEDSTRPTDLYGITKVAADLYGKRLVTLFDKPIVHLRLFSTYGPFEENCRLISSLALAISSDEKSFSLTSGVQTRDFIYVDDVVHAMILSAKNAKSLKGESINVGTGIKTSIRTVAELLKEVSSSNINLQFGTRKTRTIETYEWVANTEKMRRLLEWKPTSTLNDGLKKTVDWFKKNKKLYG